MTTTDAMQVKEALQLVCSNKPRPSVQKGAKGNEFWKRDVHHLASNDRHTLCGAHRTGWLTMRAFDPQNDVDDPNLCVRCKAALAAPSPAALDPVTVEACAKIAETYVGAIVGKCIALEIRALLSHPAPTGNAPEPVAWLAEYDGYKSATTSRSTMEQWRDTLGRKITPLYPAPASNPQEAGK